MTRSHPQLRDVLRAPRLPALDGLRAVAVLVVIFYHAGVGHVPGDLGVSIFFVLSGFLITWLLLREADATGTASLPAFYMRRVLRIFPAYFVFIAFSYAVDRLRGDVWSTPMLVSALTYTVNYFNALHGHPTSSIAHAWSLAIEEQFYLLWPPLFLLLVLRGGRRALRWGLALAIAAVALWRSYLYLIVGVAPASVYNAFDARFDELAIGCLLAVVAAEPSVSRAAATVARRAWMPLVTIALILVSRVAMPAGYHYAAGFTVDGLLIAVLLVQLLQLSGTAPWRWLDHPVVRYLGFISYPMYLYHQWGLGAGRHVPQLAPGTHLVAGLAATVIFASASYFGIERPFLALKRRFERVPTTRRGPRRDKEGGASSEEHVLVAP